MELVEFQASRIELNDFDLLPDRAMDMLGERSIELMTSIIWFLNSALIHFSRGFFSCILVMSLLTIQKILHRNQTMKKGQKS